MEYLLGGLLAAGLLLLGAAYLVQQRTTRNWLQSQTQISSEERRYYHKQILRRSFTSWLMILFAALLVGWFFLEPTLLKSPENAQDPDARANARLAAVYVAVVLFLLLLLVFLAIVDFSAVFRHGLRQQRQLLKDHQAILERETAQLRLQRRQKDSGSNGSV